AHSSLVISANTYCEYNTDNGAMAAANVATSTPRCPTHRPTAQATARTSRIPIATDRAGLCLPKGRETPAAKCARPGGEASRDPTIPERLCGREHPQGPTLRELTGRLE